MASKPISGRDYALKGARILPNVYPDAATWEQTGGRLYHRSQLLLRAPGYQPLGFLFGMSERARGEPQLWQVSHCGQPLPKMWRSFRVTPSTR